MKQTFQNLAEKKKLYPLYAASLTTFLYLCILACSNILGYDNRTILCGDLYSQYTSFIRLFLDTITGGGNFWYSFSLYFGSPTASTFAYYCMSPFNLLYLIPGISVSAATILVILCKLALAAALFSLFLQKALKQDRLFIIFFGCAYALCSFSVTMQIHIMWLDALYVLPLLMLFLIRFVDGGSLIPLVPTYAYLFITNFYMGYVVGIFSALCFLLLLILRNNEMNKKALGSMLKTCIRYAFAVVLAAGCCAILLLPAASDLFAQRTEKDTDAFRLVILTIPDILNNLFLGEMQGMGSPIPLIYCGLPVLFLLSLYPISSRISKKEKLLSGALLLFYLASAQFLPLYKFLHAFESPNWYAHRYAYCVVFLLLVLSCRAFTTAALPKSKIVCFYTVGLLLFYSVMLPFQSIRFSGYSLNSHGWFLLNALFLGLYLALFLLHNREFLKKRLLPYFGILFSVELILNGWYCMSHNQFGFFSEEELAPLEHNEELLISTVKQNPAPYRTRVMEENSFNAPSYFHYKGLNTFTTTDQSNLREGLSSLGIATSFMSIYDQGYTKLTDMLFGVRNIADASTMTVYENPYTMPLAYPVDLGLASWFPGDDVFENQQSLVNFMCNTEYEFFTPIPMDDVMVDTKNMKLTFYDDCVLFQHESDLSLKGTVVFSLPKYAGKTVLAYFTPLDTPQISSSAPTISDKRDGYQKETQLSDGSIVTSIPSEADGTPQFFLTFSAGPDYDYMVKNIRFYVYEPALLEEAYRSLAELPCDITVCEDGHLEMTVTATEDRRILFTSIPFDKGWEAAMDEMPKKTLTTVHGSFLSLLLSPGTHKVTLTYTPPMLLPASTITCVSLMIFLVLFMVERHKSQKKGEKK